MSLKRTNEAAVKSGEEHIFLRNIRDCGQRCKELWLCVNGRIKMRDMIESRDCSLFHLASGVLKHCEKQTKLNLKSFNEKGQELEML